MTTTIEDEVMVTTMDNCIHSDSKPQATSEVNSNLFDNINFDDITKQMDTLKAIIFNTPETNQIKIQVIKEELAAGRYEIHSDRIADKLLEFAKVNEQPEIA